MIGSLAVLSCPGAAYSANAQLLAGGSDDMAGAAVAFALMGVCSLVFAVTRATAVRRTFVTSRHKVDTDFELIRLVARRQRLRALAFAGACVVAGLVVARLPVTVEARLGFSVTPALMLMVALVSAWRLQPLVHLKPGLGLHVTSHAHFLYAARGGQLVGWVAAPPKLIARASSLPVARLRVVAS